MIKKNSKNISGTYFQRIIFLIHPFHIPFVSIRFTYRKNLFGESLQFCMYNIDYDMRILAIVCSDRETTWKHINFAECSASGNPDMNCMFNYHWKSCSLQQIARILKFQSYKCHRTHFIQTTIFFSIIGTNALYRWGIKNAAQICTSFGK